MAAKFFEQMLIHDMELGKAARFPRCYAVPNPMYYGLCDFNQYRRNIARLNRPDLYAMEYYRHHLWMQQPVMLPNCESVFFGRNNKRFSNGKNSFWRDKRSNAERKFYHQDDVYSSRGERRRNDFGPQFERRCQETWSRGGLHNQIPQDDRNASCLAYTSSDFDLYPENIMLEQQIHNIKQMLESGNPPSECFSMNGKLPQTDYGQVEESVQVDFQNILYQTSDLEWQNQTDKASEGKDYLDSSNFNSNESWFCPKEQQQIVDMLKEVNLRHDRQLKSDMLLSRCGLPHNVDINVSQNTESQNSISSDDSEDNINIILYPRGIPPILEEVEDSIELSKHHEITTNDSFAKFQDDFAGSQENEVINEINKKSLQSYQTLEDDDYANTAKIITDDDKNAVKTVLDFDHMDNLTGKVIDKHTRVISTNQNVTKSHFSEDENSSTIGNEQCTILHKKCQFNRKITDIEMISDSDSASVFNNSFTSHVFSGTINSDNSSSLVSANNEFPKKSLFRKDHQAEKKDISESINKNHSRNVNEYVNESSFLLASQNRVGCSETSCKKNNKSQNSVPKNISKNVYDNSILKKDSLKEKFERQCKSNLQTTKIFSTLNNAKAYVLNSFNNHLYKNQNEAKHTDEIPVKKSPDMYFSKETLKKEKVCSSKSEPFLSLETNHMGYKRISISEIFSNVNTNSTISYLSMSNHHIEHLNNLSTVGKDISPSDHLKLILGIGKQHDKNNPTIFKSVNNSVSYTSSQTTVMRDANNLNESSNFKSKSYQEKDSSVNACYKPILDSKVKDSDDKEKHFKTLNEVTKLEKSVNRKNIDKNKKPIKAINNNVNSYAPDNLEYESNITKNVHDSATNQKRKQKYKKENLGKKRISDKEMSSTMAFVEHSNNHNYYSQSNKIETSVKEVKFSKKITSDTVTNPYKSFYEPEINNRHLLNDTPTKKVKKEDSKFSNLKYSDLKNSVKDNADGVRISDSVKKNYIEPSATVNSNTNCSNNENVNSSYSTRKKLMKDSEPSTNLNSSDLPTKYGKNYSNIYKVGNCNEALLNNKNMNSSDGRKSINENETLVDCTCTEACFRAYNNIKKPSTGLHTMTIRKESKIINSKTFYQKTGRKSYEIIDVKKSHLPENRIKNESTVFMDSQLDHEKTQKTDSKSSHCETPTNKKETYTGKTRKKIRKKRGEKLVDKCENQSKTEYQDETQNNDKTDDLDITLNGITVENLSFNSKDISNNLLSTHKAKQKYLEETPTNNLNSSFKNNSAFVSDTLILKVEKCAANIEKQNSYKNWGINDQETKIISHSNGNILHKKENMTENTNLGNLISHSFQAASKEESKEKKRNEKNKMHNNEENQKNILHTKSEDFPKYSKNKNKDLLLLANSFNFPIKKTEDTCILRNMHKIKFYAFLKYSFIARNCPKTNNKNPALLNSAIPTSKLFSRTRCIKQSNKSSVEDFILTVTPEVMHIYKRNKQALKMNLLFDVQVPVFLVDFFSGLEFLRLRPQLKRCTELALRRLVEEKLLCTLPLLLNLLSFLSEVHIPWNRKNLDKMKELYHFKRETNKFKNGNSHGKEVMLQNPANAILKCWEVLSEHITIKENI